MTTRSNIHIPAPLKKWVDRQVARQGYATADDFVADVLRREQLTEESAKIDEKLLSAIDSGPATPFTAKDWETIRATGRELARKRRKK